MFTTYGFSIRMSYPALFERAIFFNVIWSGPPVVVAMSNAFVGEAKIRIFSYSLFGVMNIFAVDVAEDVEWWMSTFLNSRPSPYVPAE